MNVQMENRLSAVRIGIDHHAVTVFRKTFFAGNFGGTQKQMPEHFLMTASGFVKRCKMLARNYQNMRRSLRADIIKSHAYFIFIYFCGRNRAVDNFAKKAIFTHNGTNIIKANGKSKK